ncbi:MAG: glycosyltransferase family 1 protein [Magnetococcales bacterium]|nr:glycosyltransferase family 1 protein [Magnetococcales bacterium]
MRCLIIKHQAFHCYDDMAQACMENGVQILSESVTSPEDAQRVLAKVDRFRPDFILNYPSFLSLVSQIGAMRGIPVFHWVVDKVLDPEHIKPDSFADTDHIFAACRSDVAEYRRIGVKSRYFPNSCNIAGDDYSRYDKIYNVSYVGTIELGENNYYRQFVREIRHSVTTPQEEQNLEQLIHVLEVALSRQAEASKRFVYILPDLVSKILDTVGDAFPGISPHELTAILTKETCFHQRRHFLERIPQLDVFGPEDWTRAPLPNVRYHGVVNLRESGRVFAASTINLSISRVYSQDGLSDRIFNVLYAGGFLLTNRQETISELFQEGVDLEAYATVEELLDKIAFYENHPQAREGIARRGHENVIRNHTFNNRIRTMLPLLTRWDG